MPDDTVVLYNRNRFKSFQFTLYHHIVCKAAMQCFCDKRPAMGADQRGEFVRTERSVFIPGKGTTGPLPKEVLLVPQLRVAMAEDPPFIQKATPLAEVEVIPPTPAAKPRRRSPRRGR